MKDNIDAVHGLITGATVADIGFEKLKVRPSVLADRFPNIVEIGSMPRCEIVQSDDLLVRDEQGFDKIGTDETGCAGHQPAAPLGAYTLEQFGALASA